MTGPDRCSILLVALLSAGTAAAGEVEAQPAEEPTAQTEEEATKELLERYKASKEATMRQIQSGQGEIHIYQLIEEIVDDVVADIGEQKKRELAVIGLQGVRVSRNLSSHIAALIESTLISGLTRNTEITVKRCLACRTFKSRVEKGDWVVSFGVTDQEALRREAELLGVMGMLDVAFSWFPETSMVVMQLEVIRPGDGAVLWAETYTSDQTTAAVLRTGDRVLSRKERIMELERKLEARPYYGHHAYAGYAMISYDGPKGNISGLSGGYRLYERFGPDRSFLFGIGAEAFASFEKGNELFGAFIGATLQYDILPPDLDLFSLRFGPTISAFFAGNEGNSVAFEVGVDLVLQFRLGFGINAMYFVPTSFAGADLGGFGLKTRASFNW